MTPPATPPAATPVANNPTPASLRALSRLAQRIACAGGALTLAACAMLPAREPNAAQATATVDVAKQVTVIGRNGPVSAKAQAQTLAQVRAEGEPELVTHHLQLLAAQGETDLFRGNAARLLVDGPNTFAAMKAAIDKARGRVLLESYIVEDAGVAEEFAALLLKKAAAGVSVALMYDSVGSLGSDAAYFNRLSAGGVAVCAFNPVNPLKRPGYWGINHRDHRKLLVVDDDFAFTGGINISRVYSAGSFGRAGGSAGSSFGSRGGGGDDPQQNGWRDTQIELRGPVVPALAATFEQAWRSQGCQGALGRPAAPLAASAGQRVVKVLVSDPADADQRENRIYRTLLTAIDGARRSVHLTMAYVGPGPDMIKALTDAARSRSNSAAISAPKSSPSTTTLSSLLATKLRQSRLLDPTVPRRSP